MNIKYDGTVLRKDENSSKRSKMFNALVVIVVCPTLLLMALWILIAINVCMSLMSSTAIGKIHPKKIKLYGL